MEFNQFCYWLQGFAEISGDVPTHAEWKTIKEHLATCFTKITPPKTEFFKEKIWAEPAKTEFFKEIIWAEPPRVTCSLKATGGSIC